MTEDGITFDSFGPAAHGIGEIDGPICGVCGQPLDLNDPPPTYSRQPDGRMVLNKPIRMDPETGAVCWCPQRWSKA